MAVAAEELAAPSRTLSAVSHAGELSFMADCVLDPKSLHGIVAVGSRAPTIRFHPSVVSQLARIEDWWTNFDGRSSFGSPINPNFAPSS